jgi:hypothetical protein
VRLEGKRGPRLAEFGEPCRRRRNRSAESRQRFFSLGAPLRAAESLCGGRVPLSRLAVLAGLLVPLRQLEGHHGVTGALVQVCELRGRIGRGLCFADARLDLSPISHVRAL